MVIWRRFSKKLPELPAVLRWCVISEGRIVALRFNFCGVGTSTGSFRRGIGEQDDVRSEVDWTGIEYPHFADRLEELGDVVRGYYDLGPNARLLLMV